MDRGGAIYNTNITGGETQFLNNTAGNLGGAIYAGAPTLRATDGDITFRGNRDGVSATGTGGKANAIHMGVTSDRVLPQVRQPSSQIPCFLESVPRNLDYI
ncbi:MAG: hypothetical protein FWE95_03005 [Planctomycetaceae bacterium]|nr:hypothetical protein [Planctomycetaceae bacterium]